MRAKPARPVWAGRIEKFRQETGLSQAALAKKLNVSAMAPSRWERGINQPPASVYIQLGKLAGNPSCWYFWERAGIRKCDLEVVLPGLNQSNRDGNLVQTVELLSVGRKAKLDSENKARNLLAIPLYETSHPVGALTPNKILRDEPAEYVVAPLNWCPHPEQTLCLRLSFDKMWPLIPQGAVFAVDESEKDVAKLTGKVVLASHPTCGLMVNWLQKYGRTLMLVPENKDHPPTYLAEDDWTIVGKVLWWLAKAP